MRAVELLFGERFVISHQPVGCDPRNADRRAARAVISTSLQGAQ